MGSIAPQFLSGSANGKGIKITQVASAGDTLHTAVAGAVDMDEVFLWVVNEDTVDRELTIQFGGTTDPDNSIKQTIPAKSGLVAVCPGLRINNTQVVKAFAAAANVLIVYGYVNRITV